ncbi:hypothetical protein ACFLS8_04760 [Chloroflexota bacterium]
MEDDKRTEYSKEEFESLQSKLPGNRVIRIKRRYLNVRTFTLPTIIGMIKDFAFETPFFIMLPVIISLCLLFAMGIYFAEVGAAGSNITSYGEALWDAVVLMTTAGTMSEPVTGAGHALGAIWTIFGCLIFYGTIIASASAYFLLPLSSYFLLPRRGEEAKLVGTLQYNLGRIEKLNEGDLYALRNEINTLIDRYLKHSKGS